MSIAGEGISFRASAAVSLLNNLLRQGIDISHRCGGRAQCGTCRVRVISGRDATNPIGEREQAKLVKFGEIGDLRLACQTYVFGEVSIAILIRNRGKRS